MILIEISVQHKKEIVTVSWVKQRRSPKSDQVTTDITEQNEDFTWEERHVSFLEAPQGRFYHCFLQDAQIVF